MDSSDALTAAPDHHKLLLENDNVRVIETKIPPGETVPLHTHCWPSANYLVSWSDFIRRDGDGVILLDTRVQGIRLEPGSVMWSEPFALHTLENVGDQPLHVISVELKQELAPTALKLS